MQNIVFCFLFLFIGLLKAQNTLNGYIKEAESAEAIIGALIEDSLGVRGTQSNEYGFFSLRTNESDSILLIVRALGYKTAYYWVQATDSLPTLYLYPNNYEAIVVSDELPFEVGSRLELSMEQLERLPALGGEKDILKAITLFPGVSLSDEGSSQIIVRGGCNDQNLIMLDNTTVYNAAHFAGFISVFNTDAVKKVELYKGGFPASYGGRLSSVLNITMKEGNSKKWAGNFGIGIISSRFLLEGPIIKEKASFMVSGRAAYLGLFTLLRQPALNQGKITDNFTYNFFDFNAKFNYIINPRHHLFVSFYTGRDNSSVFERYGNSSYPNKNKTTFDWGNTTATLRHNWLISKKIFSKTQLSYTQYRYQFISETEAYSFRDSLFVNNRFASRSKISDWITKWQLEYHAGEQHQFKMGVDAIYHHYRPYLNQRTVKDSTLKLDTVGQVYQYFVPELGIFAEGQFRHNIVELHYGFRWSMSVAEDTFYQIPEPRLALLVKISERWAWRAAFTRMGQYIHLLANNGVGFPNDIWVPITKKVAPQTAVQYSLGTTWKPKNGFKVELEAYYKTMNQLIDYQFVSNSILGVDNDWQELIATQGNGRAYGLEVSVEKNIGKLTGMLAYTLSKSERRFLDIQDNRFFPFKYDRRHQFTSFIHWAINKKWDISLLWVYNSGHRITMPVALIQGNIDMGSILIYGDRNNARMPDFHRLDFGVHYKKTGKKGRLNTWSIDIYNVYNRQNAFALLFRPENKIENGQVVQPLGYKIYQISLFPILPSVSYSLKF